jgi:hypothetical protein
MFASGAELATTPFLVVVSNGPVPAPLPHADAQTARQMVSEGRYIAASDRGNIFAPAPTQERKKLLHNALVFHKRFPAPLRPPYAQPLLEI